MQNHSADGVVPTEFTVDLTEENYESVSTAIIMAIAEHVDEEPEDLDPIMGSIDPFALDALIDSDRSGLTSNLMEITFRYHGITITVTNDQKIRFRPPQPHHLNW